MERRERFLRYRGNERKKMKTAGKKNEKYQLTERINKGKSEERKDQRNEKSNKGKGRRKEI